VDAADVVADLVAESAELDALVAALPDAEWDRETPAAGWTIAHQIAHLAWTDQAALLAIREPQAFQAHLQAALESAGSLTEQGAEEFLAEPPALLARWREGRTDLADALLGLPAGSKVLWYGPPMSPTSMATARLMETWAHGLDIADTVGVKRTPTARLRHIAHLGHRTIGFSYLVHGRSIPDQPVRLELTAPDGALWTFGPEDTANRVSGSALDFCLLVTQRRHRSDLALHVEGPVADEWLDIAQAFAGPPGSGRQPSGVTP
jgi:uncharacterized protein (TIGR03084 family)